MQITSTEIIESDKRNRVSGGLYIEFTSSENVVVDNYFSIVFEDRIQYFVARTIKIDGENLKVTAKKTGYWGEKLDRKENLDLRKLIGIEVTQITDPEIIKKIKQESLYC